MGLQNLHRYRGEERELALIGLGVSTDLQPDDRLPPLEKGIHLRWGASPERGFPSHGFYLFRREHIGEYVSPISVRDTLENLMVLPGDGKIDTRGGSVTVENPNDIEVIDNKLSFPPEGIRLTLPEAAFRVDVEVSSSYGPITVTAFDGDVPVDSEIRDDNNPMYTSLSYDTITAIEILEEVEGGDLIDLKFYPVTSHLSENWGPVPDAPAPLCLPLTSPAYSCKPNPNAEEDLDAARNIARSRIKYGDPNRLTANPQILTETGTATVADGSHIVRGQGTNWDKDLEGALFQLTDDDTAYTIVQVIQDNRLVLSRPHQLDEDLQTDQSYVIAADEFGQLHDYLAQLVEGVDRGEGMSSQILAQPVHEAGTLDAWPEDIVIGGKKTEWTDDLEGLGIQVAMDTDGSKVEVKPGEASVRGKGTAWTEDLEGRQFRVGSERALYTIERIDSETRLELDRSYVGTTSGDTKYDIFEPSQYRIREVAGETKLGLDWKEPYEGPDDAKNRRYIVTPIVGTNLGNTGEIDRVTAPLQYPLDLILTGSLDPAIAQLLGLYWVDETTDPGTAYDYLVVADYSGRMNELDEQYNPDWETGNGTDEYLNALFTELTTNNEAEDPPAAIGSALDGYIGYNIRIDQPPAIDSPTGIKAYRLPGSTIPVFGSTSRAVPSTVGLQWNDSNPLPAQGTDPVAHYLWRQRFDSKPTEEPGLPAYDPMYTDDTADGDFLSRTTPILISEQTDEYPESSRRNRPTDWPPDQLSTIDNHVTDGWYSYRVTSVDLFGRHSPPSNPATWYDWDPIAKLHEYAIEIADELPPPPPAGVEASVLDPADPTVVKDDRYTNWRQEVGPNVVGLRVRWQWPETHQEQAPDTAGFRLHYQPGSFNEIEAEIIDATSISTNPPQTRVQTDITSDEPDGTYNGAILQTGGHSFPVVASEGTPVELVVEQPTTPNDEIVSPPTSGTGIVRVPPAYTRGTVTVSDGKTTVTGTNTNWTKALENQTFSTANDTREYVIKNVEKAKSVEKADELVLEQPYESVQAPLFFSGLLEAFPFSNPEAFFNLLPGRAGRSRVDPPPSNTLSYRIAHPAWTDYSKVKNWTNTPSDWQTESGKIDYEDGRSIYEILIPAPGVGSGGGSFEPSIDMPTVLAHIGINAYDDDGNEGPVPPPVSIARVWREPPEKPSLVPFEAESVKATAADYYGKSYYTVRWQKPEPPKKSHVFRALDETLFNEDSKHPAGSNGSETLVESLEAVFPPEFTEERRQKIVDDLRELNEQLEDHSVDHEAMLEAYRSLKDDTLRVLASRSENESAFTQLTVRPIDPDDSEYANQPGPEAESNDPSAYPSGEELHAYVDELDGRARNRYFYRVGTVDAANNRSEGLSLSTLPVYLPNVVPPTAPVVTNVFAGQAPSNEESKIDIDNRITIEWASNREPDLVEYRIYRSDTEDKAGDLRRMERMPDEQSVHSEPGERSALQRWTDKDVPAQKTFYYRIVAVDNEKNVSQPSEIVFGQAIKITPPESPTWDTVEWREKDGEPVVFLQWSSNEGNLVSTLQRRRATEESWRTVSPSLSQPATNIWEYIDRTATFGVAHEYRIQVVDEVGNANTSYDTFLLPASLPREE